MNLSEHFTLEEFTRSETAEREGISNIPTADHIRSMKTLCNELLEPIRAHFGKPIVISSGFRSPALCIAIGSSRNSQHAKGEAADWEIEGISNFEVAEWIRDNATFDQLILECYRRGQPNSGWIHTSYRHMRNRKQALTYTRRNYLPGLVA